MPHSFGSHSSDSIDRFAETANEITLFRPKALRIALIGSMMHSAGSSGRDALRTSLTTAIENWDYSMLVALGTAPINGLSTRRLASIRGVVVGRADWVQTLRQADEMVHGILSAFGGYETPDHSLIEEFVAFTQDALEPMTDLMVNSIWNETNRNRTAAFSEARRSQKVVQTAIERINEISQSVRLISLNAAVEASHAVAAGRGFSVIAEEIRSLSEQIESATQDAGDEVEALNLN